MRPVVPSAEALLAAWGFLFLSLPALAFIGLSSFALINEGRSLLQRAILPSHCGGLEGSPPGHDVSATGPQDGRGRQGDGSNPDEEEEEEEQDEGPFPVWKGMSAFEAGEADPPSAGVIVVDPFCDYLGKRCIDILEGAGYAVVQVLSEHLVTTMDNREGAEVFGPPSQGKEAAWAAWLPFPLVAVFCESDAGLATAERLQAALLGPRFGGVNDARRDKFLMVEAMRRAGLSSTRQVKTGKWSEAREFFSTLEPSTSPSTSTSTSAAAVVVKPARGCASGDVFLCRGEDEAKKAFYKILGTPKYGTPGAMNDEVVIQEFLVGTEWVVDTVSRDGDHKAMAIWRYDKRSVNGAPFVYFSTQLMPSDGYDAKRVAEYAFQALDALGVKFGPTHTEVMMVGADREAPGDDHSDNARGSPTLIEVNTRWHLTDFAPLTDACVGYNAVEETLSAYLDPGRFDSLPRLPPTGRDTRHGRVVHLVSHVEGELKEIYHEEEIRSMESFAGIDVYSDPARGGSGIMRKTIDIRSDAGWVRLVHEKPEIVERDFRRVVELMPTMFEVEMGGIRDPSKQ